MQEREREDGKIKKGPRDDDDDDDVHDDDSRATFEHSKAFGIAG